MAKKKPFVLRLDEDMLRDVEKWAADEFRSTNGQLEWIIRDALVKAKRLRKPTEISDDKSQATGTEA